MNVWSLNRLAATYAKVGAVKNSREWECVSLKQRNEQSIAGAVVRKEKKVDSQFGNWANQIVFYIMKLFIIFEFRAKE